jgi:hypothetical protein
MENIRKIVRSERVKVSQVFELVEAGAINRSAPGYSISGWLEAEPSV